MWYDNSQTFFFKSSQLFYSNNTRIKYNKIQLYICTYFFYFYFILSLLFFLAFLIFNSKYLLIFNPEKSYTNIQFMVFFLNNRKYDYKRYKINIYNYN